MKLLWFVIPPSLFFKEEDRTDFNVSEIPVVNHKSVSREKALKRKDWLSYSILQLYSLH